MRRSKSKLFAIMAIAVITIGALYVYSPSSLSVLTGSHRLGFWLQEADIIKYTWQGGYQQQGATHPAQLFFNSMFLTPPYPSSAEIMIFAILQAKNNNQGCATTSGYIGNSIGFWGDLASLANSYNIQLNYEIAFDVSGGTYGLSCFNSMVQAFGGYSSIYGLGVEGEYTFGVTDAQMQTAQGYVTATGKQFVNYYIHGPTQQWGSTIAHTNFPGGDAGGYDQVGTLGIGGPGIIGLSSGYYASFQFPGSVTCPVGATAMSSATGGWNQCVVSTELSTAIAQPASSRQFLEFAVGFSSSGNFAGVSGQSTNQLWDNPTLRNWIATDPNYAGFITSGGGSNPPPSTTTASTSTTTITSATTITSTSGSSTITTTSSTTLTSTMGQPPPTQTNPTFLIALVVIVGGGAYLLLRRRR